MANNQRLGALLQVLRENGARVVLLCEGDHFDATVDGYNGCGEAPDEVVLSAVKSMLEARGAILRRQTEELAEEQTRHLRMFEALQPFLAGPMNS